MGGSRIELRSEPGHGSTFSFSLPFELADRERSGDPNAEEFRGLRVLIVDDSTSSYMGLEETLKTWSAEVAVLNRGRMVGERLRSAALRGQPFDAVLLDHGLPDVSSVELLREIRMDQAVAGTYVVLLTALAFDPTYEGTKAIEPDTCIAKPVRQESLKTALRAARAPRTAARPSAVAHGANAAGTARSGLGLKVLVVDDNVVNREVAVAMLEEAHCRTTVAEDGQAAVRAACQRRFDVILMDCQMPGMDGFAATAAIRRFEADKGVPPATIIALTANVLSRDRARCLDAGMDAFLGKPFTSAQLTGALLPIAEARGTLHAIDPDEITAEPEAVMLPAKIAEAASAVEDTDVFDPAVTDMLGAPLFETAPRSLPILDDEQIKAIRSLGKPQVLERLCELLLETAPGTLQSIERNLAAADLPAVAAAAHSLKSASSNLGGRRFADQLDRCESLAREGRDLAAVRAVAAGLPQAYAAFEAALRNLASRRTGT
jgi:CheY-like chemotaxis protein